jgi:hypothetical protein
MLEIMYWKQHLIIFGVKNTILKMFHVEHVAENKMEKLLQGNKIAIMHSSRDNMVYL